MTNGPEPEPGVVDFSIGAGHLTYIFPAPVFRNHIRILPAVTPSSRVTEILAVKSPWHLRSDQPIGIMSDG